MAQLDGFTPMPEPLIKRYGIQTAAVFGRIWRYCQMADGICRASQNKIASELGISRVSVNKEIQKLVNDGFLKDLTPGLKNKPHTYADTGKVALYNKFGVALPVNGIDSEKQSTVNVVDSTVNDVDSHCKQRLHEDSIKKELKRIPPSRAKPDFVNLTVTEALGIREIQIYRDTTGMVPGTGQYETIWTTIRTLNGNGTPDTLRPYWLEWCARGYSSSNLAWLTEWATSGSIPPATRPAPRTQKPKSTIEQIRELA